MNGTSATAPVTAVLFCYLQEEVVEAAVRSILAQTVQPAEIILSDDASPDGSYEVLRRLAREYNGHSKLVVRRTEGKSGWFAHINACIALATHDHVMVFAGDDVSDPGRIGRFMEEISRHPETRLIWSLMERMTPEGRPTGKVMGAESYIPGRLRGGVGASQCWHKELFTVFGNLPEVQAAEDIVLPFRAWLLGGLRNIPEPLVLWRDRDYRKLTREQLHWTYEIRATQFRINASKVVEADLAYYLEKHPEKREELASVGKRLARESVSVTAEYEVVSASSKMARFRTLLPRLKALGFKRFRRLLQDQVLGLPAYLDSAYSRSVRRWIAGLCGLGLGLLVLVSPFPIILRLGLVLPVMVLTVEAIRMLLRMMAKILWKPE